MLLGNGGRNLQPADSLLLCIIFEFYIDLLRCDRDRFWTVSRATCNAGGHRGVGCLRRRALAGMIDGLDLGWAPKSRRDPNLPPDVYFIQPIFEQVFQSSSLHCDHLRILTDIP